MALKPRTKPQHTPPVAPARTRGVLSLWTRTPMFRPQRGPMLIQTLAVCLARRAFIETAFVTDTKGADIAAMLGWRFDEVSTAFDAYLAHDSPNAAGLEHVWALGKLVALRLQERPCVQFDGDVLLFKPLPQRITRARLCAQSHDFPRFYLGDDMARGMQQLGLRPGGCAFNAGLIGGADIPLLHDYAAEALHLARSFRGFDLNGTTASMLCEQYHLGAFAARRRVRVETLLPMMPTRRQVRRAGYAHLWGDAKRRAEYIGKAEVRLAREFPEAYAAFCHGWQFVAREYEHPVESVWSAAL